VASARAYTSALNKMLSVHEEMSTIQHSGQKAEG
jgi:hypothetical protein